MNNMFKSNKFKHGTMATLFTVVFIAIVIVINIVVSVLTERFPSMDIDLTSQGLNTLSEDAVNVAKEVTEPTTIYIIGSEEAIRGNQIYSSYGLSYSQVANLADRMRETNSNMISVEFIDPDMNPSFISEYPDDSLTSGKVLVKSDKRYKVLTVSDLFSIQQNQTTGQTQFYSKVDGALANAVHLVNLQNVPVIAVATGHDEILSSDARAALDTLLSDNSFDVVEFNILTEEIPEDAQAVLIATPSTDYTADEITKLNNFLNDKTKANSRSLFVTSHPTQGKLPVLHSFLEDWGIGIGEGVVVESDSSKALSANISYIYANSTDVLFSDTYSYLLAPYSSPLTLTFDYSDDITTYSLVETSDTCYVSLDNEVKENPDTSKQITTALAQKYLSIDGNNYRSNVIVFGSTIGMLQDFISGSTFSNGQYLTDLVKYATDTADTRLGLTVSSVETSVVDITATAGVVNFVGFILFTIIVPVAILVIGLVVFLRRRHL